MVEEITRNYNIKLAIERCYDCGHFWAYESRVGNATCPVCARRKLDAIGEELAKLEKRLTAQKSATTRASNGRKP